MRGLRWLLAVVFLSAAGAAVWLLWSICNDEPSRTAGTEDVHAVRDTPSRADDEKPTPAGGASDAGDGEDARALAWGRHYFWDAIQWVEQAGEPVDRISSFHARLDVKLQLASGQLDGPIEVWYLAPHRFRLDRESNAGTTSIVLVNDRGWRLHASGRTEEITAASGPIWGEPGIGYVRRLCHDLVILMSLRPLWTRGARFEFSGYKRGSGTYAGNWIKLTRVAPDKRNILFWVSYERTSEDHVRATWPGIVRIEGDPQRDGANQDYIFKEWHSPVVAQDAGRRYPRRVEAYVATEDSSGGRVPRRFLFAVVEDLHVNQSVEDHLFEPPVKDD